MLTVYMLSGRAQALTYPKVVQSHDGNSKLPPGTQLAPSLHQSLVGWHARKLAQASREPWKRGVGLRCLL